MSRIVYGSYPHRSFYHPQSTIPRTLPTEIAETIRSAADRSLAHAIELAREMSVQHPELWEVFDARIRSLEHQQRFADSVRA